MNRHEFVPVGYPKYITEIRNEQIQQRMKHFYHALWKNARFVTCNKGDLGDHFILTLNSLDQNGLSVVDLLLTGWMNEPEVRGAGILHMEFAAGGVLVKGEYVTNLRPVGINSRDEPPRYSRIYRFDCKILDVIPMEQVAFLYDYLDHARVDIDAWDNHAEEDHSIPQTTQVRIVYTRQGGRIGIHATRIVEGSFVIPGVTSVENGMVMDVEARRLKSGDTFWLVEGEKDDWSGMVTVDHLEEV